MDYVRWCNVLFADAAVTKKDRAFAKRSWRKLMLKPFPAPERRTSYLDSDIRPVGVIVVGDKYELAFINEVFCKKLGYEKAELAGASLIDIAAPAEQEKCKRLLIEAF